MADEIRRLIRVRAQKGARFKRDGFGKKSQLSDSWRKPRGQHNKQREQKKAKGNLPKPGFGSPVSVRGMHPSGFYDVLVYTAEDLKGLNPKTHAVRISANVGNRKRAGIQEKALSAGLKVLNAREVPSSAGKTRPVPGEAAKEKLPQKKEPKKKEKLPKKEKPGSKIKAIEPPKAKEEKKGPEKAVTKKKEKPGQVEEKIEKKTKKVKVSKAKAETTQAEQPKAKKSQKPKAEAAKEPKAKPKAAAKPATRPKKKTGTGVKGNE
jgi:large subunit ribosomal protein L32e